VCTQAIKIYTYLQCISALHCTENMHNYFGIATCMHNGWAYTGYTLNLHRLYMGAHRYTWVNTSICGFTSVYTGYINGCTQVYMVYTWVYIDKYMGMHCADTGIYWYKWVYTRNAWYYSLNSYLVSYIATFFCGSWLQFSCFSFIENMLPQV